MERVEKAMTAEGYTEGPDKFHTASVREGDTIIMQLRGNLRFQETSEEALRVAYNSNLPTMACFQVSEVDRSGVVVVVVAVV